MEKAYFFVLRFLHLVGVELDCRFVPDELDGDDTLVSLLRYSGIIEAGEFSDDRI